MRPNRGEWYVGFGWDESLWPPYEKPHISLLDELFPNNPVAFSRVDGHSLWVNSLAIRTSGISTALSNEPFLGGRMERDDHGQPKGIFIDAAKEFIERHIPQPTGADLNRFLLEGMQVFYQNGFTHIRDVGGSFLHWQMASELENKGALKIFCEMLFNLDVFENLDQRIAEIQQARQQPHKQLRQAGLKLYFDGALGSEGALLSRPYPSGKQGIMLYDLKVIEEILIRCWAEKIPVAIHTLGDEAVHMIVTLALQLKDRGHEGELHLEHCEVVRPETIKLMKALNIRCHLQPSHFLSDQRWLKAKLGDLYKCSFPWRNLIEAGVPISFGSDSPIEGPSLVKTQKAIEIAANEGILSPPVSFWNFHSHYDGVWGRDCVTRLRMDGSVDVDFLIE